MCTGLYIPMICPYVKLKEREITLMLKNYVISKLYCISQHSIMTWHFFY